jgi:hypothetical protein
MLFVELNLRCCAFAVYPLYDAAEQAVPKKIINGLTGFIDPRYTNRSFEEAKLAELIPQCWIYDAKQRIDIIQLVDFLRIAMEESSKQR